MASVPLQPVTASEPAVVAKQRRWRSLRATHVGDRIYRLVLLIAAAPCIRKFGPSFVWKSVWDPVAEVFGAAPLIFGTVASSVLALIVAVPLALGMAIFVTEFAPRWIRQPLSFL